MGSAVNACTPSVQQKHPGVPNATASTNSPMPQVSLNSGEVHRVTQKDISASL